MPSLFFGLVKLFLFFLLPVGILCGILGSIIRYCTEGNEHEDFFVYGAMLLFAAISVLLFGLC